MKSAGRIFLTGVLTVLPVLATFYFALWMLTAVEWFFGQQLKWLMPDEYYRAGMGLALAIFLIFIVGLLMHALVFRRVFGAVEHLLLEIPILRSVYAAVRDLLPQALYLANEFKAAADELEARVRVLERGLGPTLVRALRRARRAVT